MSTIPKKVVERFQKNVTRFQTILKIAKQKDINESDTVSIINDILSDMFGFDKFFEITSELAIKSTFCDLAIKIDDKVQYLIEVKAIGTDLKDNHLKQAVNYGANSGFPWVILTNSIIWNIYKIKVDKTVSEELICTFNLLEINPKKDDDQEKLFLLCKEGLIKSARDEFLDRKHSVNKFIIGAILLTEPIIHSIKKELRSITAGLKVENPEIEKILREEVLKRDIFEGDFANKAAIKIKKSTAKKERKPAPNIKKEITENVTEQENLTNIKDINSIS